MIKDSEFVCSEHNALNSVTLGIFRILASIAGPLVHLYLSSWPKGPANDPWWPTTVSKYQAGPLGQPMIIGGRRSLKNRCSLEDTTP